MAKFHRSIIRCVQVNDDAAVFAVPGMGRDRVKCARQRIPAEVWDKLERDLRLFAEVNLGGAEPGERVEFQKWEVPTETAAQQLASIRAFEARGYKP